MGNLFDVEKAKLFAAEEKEQAKKVEAKEAKKITEIKQALREFHEALDKYGMKPDSIDPIYGNLYSFRIEHGDDYNNEFYLVASGGILLKMDYEIVNTGGFFSKTTKRIDVIKEVNPKSFLGFADIEEVYYIKERKYIPYIEFLQHTFNDRIARSIKLNKPL